MVKKERVDKMMWQERDIKKKKKEKKERVIDDKLRLRF